MAKSYPFIRILQFALILFLSFESYSQDYCGFDQIQNKLLKQNKKFFEKSIKFENQYLRYAQTHHEINTRDIPHFTLPVVVHIIHDGGAENISDDDVRKGIENLNEAYANTGYYDQNTGVVTGIQFCLAQRAPDGSPTTGINRVQSTLTKMDLTTDDEDLKNLIRWDPYHYINIWLVKDICAGNLCSVVGYAHFPAAHGSNVDGLVVEASYFAKTKASASVQIHEMGHYLGLYHTFQGGCKNDDCLNDGDKVCDTPPDASTAIVKCGDDFNSCSTDSLSGFSKDQNDMYWDYMDYGDFNCYSAFTEGQRLRMIFTITNIRSSLLESKACIPLCSENLIADFSIPSDKSYLGETVYITNTSSSNAVYYSWEIDGEEKSTDKNFTYQFSELGIHTIKLTIYNSDKSCYDFVTKTVEILCPAKVEINSSNTNVLSGESVNFQAISPGNNSYKWYVDDNLISSGQQFSYAFSSEGVKIIKLISHNIQWDCSDSASIKIIVTCPVLAKFKTDFYFPGINEQVHFTNTSVNANVYNWKINDIPVSNNKDLNYSFPTRGEYSVCLEAENGNCKKEFCMQIFVLDSTQTECNDVYVKEIGAPGIQEKGNYIIKISNNKFVIGGNAGSNSLLIFINNKGEILKTKIIDFLPNDNQIYFLYKDNNGYLIGSGMNKNLTKVFVFKYDVNTDLLLWTNIIGPGNNLRISDIYQLKNGNYLISEQINGSIGEDAYIAEIDNNSGKILWHKHYNSGSVESFRSILVHNDAIYGTGRFAINSSSQEDFRGTLMKMDLGGNEKWTKYYIKDVNKSARLYISNIIDDNGIILVGNGNEINSSLDYNTFQIIKTNYLGEVLWDKSYKINQANWIGIRKTINLPNGYIVGGDFEYSPNLRNIFLSRLNKNGDLIWSKSYKINTHSVMGSLSWNNGYFYISGTTGKNNNSDIFFLKVNNNGNIESECSIPVNELIINVSSLSKFNEKINVDKYNASIQTSLKSFNVNSTEIEENDICKKDCLDTCLFVPDAAFDITEAKCAIDSFVIDFEICNNGNSDLPVNMPVTFYDNNPVSAFSNIIGTFFTPNTIPKDSCYHYSFKISSPSSQKVFGFANDDGTTITPFNPEKVFPNTGTNECNWNNNLGFIELNTAKSKLLNLGNDTTMCIDGIINLNAGSGFESYLWNDGSTDSIYTAWNPGKYWVKVVDLCGNIQSDTIEITIDSSDIIDLGEDKKICYGDSISFELNGFENLKWKPENVIKCTGDCNNITIKPKNDMQIVVTATNSKGCLTTDTLNITVFTIEKLELPNDTTISLGDKILIIPEFNDNNYYTYNWTPDIGLSCIDCYSPIASPVNSTEYTLYVKDNNGCNASDDIYIKVKKDINIYIPNVFTPNGDGVNDVFYVRGKTKGINEISYKIYDRWGELIYEKHHCDINNPLLGWDGTFKGKKVNPDVFVYVILIELIDNSTIIRAGDITVLK